jgi:predicted phosphodiesterase
MTLNHSPDKPKISSASTGKLGRNFDFKPTDYRGLLVIGDPHIEGRVPGFRKDDYPRTVLEKLRWCLAEARRQKLLPVLLGDLFQLPRDNPNWLIVELLGLFDSEIVGIYGNHDVHENSIGENDSLSILAEAGRIQLLDEQNPYRAIMGGRAVFIGGTPWGQQLPTAIDIQSNLPENETPLVIWICHHDLIVPGYEESGKIELDTDLKIDLIINGHIHRRLQAVESGRTVVLTPGNITRRKRSDATREHVPSVMKVEIDSAGWKYEYIEVPHRPFDEVFYEAITDAPLDEQQSNFVAGLAELQARRTETGAGLSEFLEKNLGEFDDAVAQEIKNLAQEVLHHDS